MAINPGITKPNPNARMVDTKLYEQAGINPKTGMPSKNGNVDLGFKPHNKKLLRIIDEQDAIFGRYRWYKLPNGLNQELIERVLYYKGQGMFFYMETTDTFYFLPYALDGTIDVYGRYTGVTPLPFNGSTEDNQKKEKAWIKGLTRKPVYDLHLDIVTLKDATESCVLLHDYCLQYSQSNISRQILNDPLLDVMADCVPFMRTALQNGTGITGMRVNTEDEESNVKAASRSINRAALVGDKYVPIIGQLEFQDLTGGEVAKAEEFLLAMQSLDNYRLSTYGIKNGGLFQKKAHMLQDEQDVSGISNSPLEDGLWQRQHFCEIVNSIWGLGIWCDTTESAIGADRDMDGTASDNDGTYEDPYEGGEEDGSVEQ